MKRDRGGPGPVADGGPARRAAPASSDTGCACTRNPLRLLVSATPWRAA